MLRLITRKEEKLQATITEKQKNCSLDIRTLFVSIRLWQSTSCSRIVLLGTRIMLEVMEE